MEVRSKSELAFFIKADMMMNRGKFKWALTDRVKHLIMPDFIMNYLYAMRNTSFYSYLNFKVLPPPCLSNILRRFLVKLKLGYWNRKYQYLGIKLGFSIGCNSLGYGVFIPHYGTIVVGDSNRIGNYAVLHTSTTVSGNGKVIGDALYLSTGAKMTSKLSLGNNISVAANSVVNKSFEADNLVIGGIPANVIKESQAWYVRDGSLYSMRVQKIEELKRHYSF